MKHQLHLWTAKFMDREVLNVQLPFVGHKNHATCRKIENQGFLPSILSSLPDWYKSKKRDAKSQTAENHLEQQRI